MVEFRPSQTGVKHGDHTADIWLEAYAEDLSEVISRTIMGIYGVMSAAYEMETIDLERRITVTGPDPETALVDALSEVLFLFDSESFVFTETVSTITKKEDGVELDIKGRGGMSSIPEGCGGLEVKAITYHGAALILEEGKVSSRVLLDI